MSINLESPQINSLRCEVEKHVGKINGHDKLIRLNALIEEKCKEHISITTLERIWGYSTRKANNVSERILDIIARFIDAESWDSFCNRQKEKRESELFTGKDVVSCDTLEKGMRIRFGWLPDRTCEAEYLGNYRFIAVRSKNASIKCGDTFRCFQIQKGRELHMDNFTRKGEAESNARYVAGQINGITFIETIRKNDKNS